MDVQVGKLGTDGGTVEADEAYIGRSPAARRGRHPRATAAAPLDAIANVSLIRSSSRRGHRNYRPVTPNRGWPMRHASTQTLQQLSDLLDQIRRREGLKEKKLGIFYRRSKSFLHFHEDPAGTFADVTFGETFDRYPVNTAKQHKELLAAIDRILAE